MIATSSRLVAGRTPLLCLRQRLHHAHSTRCPSGLHIQHRREARGVVANAADDGGVKSRQDAITLRSEAEAPFRSLRLVLFGFFCVSASLGFLISLPQLVGALRHADHALELNDVLTNIGIDLGAVAVFAFFLSRDWQAREQQIARLGREESLGALPIQLASGKRMSLSKMRGAARCVMIAGTSAQVAAAVLAAEPYREDLQMRGVLLVALPIFGDSDPTSPAAAAAPANSSSSSAAAPAAAGAAPSDQRWRVTGLQSDAWREWFTTQLKFTKKDNATVDKGLYVGLRMDGRVRASGTGQPPWARFVAELAPIEGEGGWKGFFDGFDGKV